MRQEQESTHQINSCRIAFEGMVTSPSNMEVIKMQLPSFEELFTNRSAALTCMVPLMNASANATFSWTMDGKPANNNSVTNEVFQESNHTSLMYGQLQVNMSEWTSTAQFTCSIQNGQGETKTKHFDRRNGKDSYKELAKQMREKGHSKYREVGK